MAMMVIVYHVAMWIPNSFTEGNLSLIKYTAGHTVPIFWCLSGFVFNFKYSKAICLDKLSFKKYSLARFSRLYPLALLTLVLTCLLQLRYEKLNTLSFVFHKGDPYHFFLNAFMISHWGFQRFTAFNGPVWSISVEIIVYIVFFVVCRFAGRSPLLIVGMLLLGKVLAHIEPDLTNHLPVSTCITSFYSGCLVQLGYEKMKGKFGLKQSLVLLGIFLTIFVCHILFSGKFDFLLSVPATVYIFQVLFSSPSQYLTSASKYLGSLTYASYMLHFPVLLASVLILDSFGIERSVVGTPAFMWIFIASVLILSRVSFLYFEGPLQRLIRR